MYFGVASRVSSRVFLGQSKGKLLSFYPAMEMRGRKLRAALIRSVVRNSDAWTVETVVVQESSTGISHCLPAAPTQCPHTLLFKDLLFAPSVNQKNQLCNGEVIVQ